MAETNEQLRSKLDRAFRLCETRELEAYAALERYRLAKETMLARYGESLGLDERHLGPRGGPIASAHRELGELAARWVDARAALETARQSVRELRGKLLRRHHRRR